MRRLRAVIANLLRSAADVVDSTGGPVLKPAGYESEPASEVHSAIDFVSAVVVRDREKRLARERTRTQAKLRDGCGQ